MSCEINASVTTLKGMTEKWFFYCYFLFKVAVLDVKE